MGKSSCCFRFQWGRQWGKNIGESRCRLSQHRARIPTLLWLEQGHDAAPSVDEQWHYDLRGSRVGLLGRLGHAPGPSWAGDRVLAQNDLGIKKLSFNLQTFF
jgi:hypothetical protein